MLNDELTTINWQLWKEIKKFMQKISVKERIMARAAPTDTHRNQKLVSSFFAEQKSRKYTDTHRIYTTFRYQHTFQQGKERCGVRRAEMRNENQEWQFRKLWKYVTRINKRLKCHLVNSTEADWMLLYVLFVVVRRVMFWKLENVRRELFFVYKRLLFDFPLRVFSFMRSVCRSVI